MPSLLPPKRGFGTTEASFEVNILLYSVGFPKTTSSYSTLNATDKLTYLDSITTSLTAAYSTSDVKLV